MRIGTVLSYMLNPGQQSYGVVHTLVNPSVVGVHDRNGGNFLVFRGQGHKLSGQYEPGGQNYEFAQSLRGKFGIGVGEWQKHQFGRVQVHRSEKRFTKRTLHHAPGFPLEIPEHFDVLVLGRIETAEQAVKMMTT